MLTMQHVGENPKESEPKCVGGGGAGKKEESLRIVLEIYIESVYIKRPSSLFVLGERQMPK